MQAGDVVDGRFEIEGVAGEGGMGVVYRARDRRTGATVALKVLHREAMSDVARERFLRESRVLRELSHPNIVRHLGQGATGDDMLWLAMEWLEGEDLRARLSRGALDVADSVNIALGVADALGAAHGVGVVHRDVKPSNVFLVGNDQQVKVLDFGVAHDAEATAADGPTETGVVLGTVGYLAPEQAGEGGAADARADVFSLGCVLYECLTGRRAFEGSDVVAMLTKVLFEEAARVRELAPAAPRALDDLVARMLAKDAQARPADGAEVAAALRALGPLRASVPPPTPSASGLTESERRLVAYVLGDAPIDAMSAVARAHDAKLERLGGGTSAIALHGGHGASATDLAAVAARAALELRAAAPRAPLALATASRGDAADRAVSLLLVARSLPERAIRIDETTAGLLDASFEVSGDALGLVLVGARDATEPRRTLLGQPTTLVGRERELAALLATWDECVGEPRARAVLVTGDAGLGKSRLRYELVRRLEERGGRFELFIGRGDPVGAGSPYHLVAQALRRAAGLADGEALVVRQRKLRARVARHVAARDAPRVAEFLGEIVGTPFPDDDEARVELRAARQDAQLMADQKRRAWEDFARAECAAGPLLLVLEDLHWGDAPTVKLVDAALRACKDLPLLVVALARPEVHAVFPRLWRDRGVEEFPLRGLRAGAASRLAREVLGQRAREETIARVVERANGNAFYLEELLRAVSVGSDDALPETVLAMTVARLEALPPASRRVLRAAAVFGQAFWAGAIRALVAPDDPEPALAALVDEELIAPRPAPRFAGETEYVFRHALVREAAYAMLLDDDLARGHRLAAAWLEGVGESDAAVLAEHSRRGGDVEGSIAWYLRGAEQALQANDLGAAIERAERGLASGARAATRGMLRLLQAEAHAFRGENADAERRAIEAAAHLARGTSAWYRAAARVAEASTRLGRHERAQATIADLLDAAAGASALDDVALIALCECVPPTVASGHYVLATELVRRIDAVVARRKEASPLVAGYVARAASWFSVTSGDVAEGARQDAVAAACFERAGDVRAACQARASHGASCILLGLYDDAARALDDALPAAEALGAQRTVAHCLQSLGLALARRGAPAAAIDRLSRSVTLFREQGDVRHTGFSRIYLAQALAAAGRLDEAEREAREAAEGLAAFQPVRAYALASLSRVRAAQGDAAGARAHAEDAMRLLDTLGAIEEGEEAVRLAYARALLATGAEAEARVVIAEAKRLLLARADKVSVPTWRASMLTQVVENAHILSLARGWGV